MQNAIKKAIINFTKEVVIKDIENAKSIYEIKKIIDRFNQATKITLNIIENSLKEEDE